MKVTLSMIKLITILIVSMTSQFALANDGYIPPVTFENVVRTFTVNKDGSYRVVNETSKQVETQEGVGAAGEYDIPYVPAMESIELLYAYTQLPDGTHINVPKENIKITNDELNRGGLTYSDTKHEVIIFPKVVVGSQVHIKFVKVQHIPIFPGQFTFTSYITPQFRFEHLVLNFNFEKGVNINFDSKGFDGGQLPEKNGMRRYQFSIKQDNVIALSPNNIQIQDFAPHLLASTYPYYASLGRAYQDKAGLKATVHPSIQNLADDLTKEVKDQRGQVRVLYNWVAKNIRYVASYMGNGGYVPHDSQTILNNRWGDCKDHVVILGALLKAKGIESSPALINANNSFELPNLPELNAFNHVITYVPSLDMYLDSTDQFAIFGVLPKSDLGKPVVLTALNRTSRTPSMMAEKEVTENTVNLKVMADGTIKATTLTNASGAWDAWMRSLMFYTRTRPREQVVNAWLNSSGLSGHGQIQSSDPLNLDTPFSIRTSYTLDPISNIPGPAAMPIPSGVAVSALTASMFPKPENTINFPVKCDSSTNIDHMVIEFPANIKIRHIPENVSYADTDTKYTASYDLDGNKLEIDRKLVVQYPTRVCGAEENNLDKKFFPIYQRDMRAQIIYD